MRSFIYLFGLFFLAGWQVLGSDVTTIWNAAINLPALLVLAHALYQEEIPSTWFGFVVGLVGFAPEISMIGMQTLLLSGLGLIAFHVRDKLNLDSPVARLLVVFLGTLIHNLTTIGMQPSIRSLELFLFAGLGGAVYTTAAALLFFFVKEQTTTSDTMARMPTRMQDVRSR